MLNSCQNSCQTPSLPLPCCWHLKVLLQHRRQRQSQRGPKVLAKGSSRLRHAVERQPNCTDGGQADQEEDPRPRTKDLEVGQQVVGCARLGEAIQGVIFPGKNGFYLRFGWMKMENSAYLNIYLE